MRSPFYKDNNQAIDLKKKNNDLEAKLQKLNQEINAVKT
jgi:uncharacterized protein YlxW (UPF0749 family)